MIYHLFCWLLADSSGEKNIMQFRNVSASWSSEDVPMYTMKIDHQDQAMAKVIRSRDNLVLLHFKSVLFVELYDKIFHRLEIRDGISVFLTKDGAHSPIIVELHRLGLNFQVDCASCICKCTQLSMDVAIDQDIRTLRTLQNKLVLERGSGSTRERILIVPAGCGASRDIKATTLVQLPPWGSNEAQVHQYVVDEELKQLRGKSEHSLLYMAFLSAFTGDSIVVPFTGITGLDMALLLLRHCKSNKPYDTESLRLLKMVISCAPKRKPAGLYEDVEWSPCDDPLARSDALFLLPGLMVFEANQLSALHVSSANTIKANQKLAKECLEGSPLYKRAYWLAKEYYPQSALLESGEEQKLELQLLRSFSIDVAAVTSDRNASAFVAYLSENNQSTPSRSIFSPDAFRAFCTTTGS
jgi:hypothetical protein